MHSKEKRAYRTEVLITQIRNRALNLYQTRQMLCTEAVVVSLNRGLGGGLTEAQAVAMSAPFCTAMGESGCLCGALSGAVMASGLFLAKGQPFRHRGVIRESARQLHDAFKASNGSTCCRTLSKNVKHDQKAHFRHCTRLTAEAAELAARLILKKRPELANNANKEFLHKKQFDVGGLLLRLAHYFSH